MCCAADEFGNVVPGADNADDTKYYDKEAVYPAKKMVIVDNEAAV
jgi:hypothetical protein